MKNRIVMVLVVIALIFSSVNLFARGRGHYHRHSVHHTYYGHHRGYHNHHRAHVYRGHYRGRPHGRVYHRHTRVVRYRH